MGILEINVHTESTLGEMHGGLPSTLTVALSARNKKNREWLYRCWGKITQCMNF
jgi:hypothetical protein